MIECCITAYTSHRSDSNSVAKEKTRVIHGPENTLKTILKSLDNAKKTWCVCVESTIPAVSAGEKLWRGYQDASARGVKIKYITGITKENSQHCKKIMSVAELRHMSRILGSFALSESEYVSAYKRSADSSPYDQLVYSNLREMVAQQQSTFDVFWDSAVPAMQKIREIEEGIEVPKIESMLPADAARLAWQYMESAAKEILVIFPSAASFNLTAHSTVGTALWKKVMEKGDIKFNILVPRGNDQVMETVRKVCSDIPKIEIRVADSLLKSKMLFLMIDGRHLFMWEPAKQEDTSEEVRGSSLYCNSAPIVSSCVSIFESLMRQTYLYEHIRHVNEQLEAHNKMQQEFINIAAHELRTPIQPILVMTSLWKDNPVKDGKVEVKEEQIEMITRNAVRLQRLSSDILEVARIESQNLVLNKKKVNLTEIISVIVNEASQFADDNIEFQLNGTQDNVYIKADRGRIIQVLSNLLNNAIRFTGSGKNTISISVDKQEGEKSSDGGTSLVKVIVGDTGKGIDAEIMPRLFTRFASKTDAGTGTGLGLYISKKIIEAHGGGIWAENNRDGPGATFTFTLPLAAP